MGSFLKPVFVFAKDYLQNDGAIIVIHRHHVSAKSTILGYCIEYNFETCKESLCMNCFHLCSPQGPWMNKALVWTMREESRFWQMLIEASTLLGDIVLDCSAMIGEASSIQFGFWKWLIAQIIIRPQLGLDIMLCGFFYAGASIHACRSLDCHIMALEEDKEVFFALLAPLMRSPPVSSLPQPQVAHRSQDPDAMEIVLAKIKKRLASK
jgi:hypothetical protein